MNERRVLHSLCLLHKILRSNEPAYLSDFFTLQGEIRARVTRTSNLDIYLPDTHVSSIHYKSFKHYTARLWNMLPHDVRSIKNNKTFKNKLKKMLLTKKFKPPAP